MCKSPDGRKGLLTAGILFNIGLLCVFKYAHAFGLGVSFPLGISFYCFQQIAFLADSYRQAPDVSLTDYSLFVLFFPKAVQGPIPYGSELLPQLRASKPGFPFDRFSRSLFLFAMGLAKKVLLADKFAIIADYGFGTIGALTSFEALLTILERCFASGNDIKTVYWELDQFQLEASPTEHRYPVPEYLYNSDWTDDVSYLLNLDIMYHYGLNNILGSLRGQVMPAERRGITLYGNFGRGATLASYSRPAQSSTRRGFEGAMKGKVNGNLANITTLVEAHPDTEFVFFMPPFSILYWDREVRGGGFDAAMDATEYAMSVLLEYDNVRFYYYQMETETILDLDNYKDYSHYGSWVNDAITAWIAEDRGRVTPENYADVVEQARAFIRGFDFASVLE